MKTIQVVAAIIQQNNYILATQRGYGEFKGGWEFPGGKVEKGETKEEALKREIQEELKAEIKISSYFDTIEYDYPSFHLSMDCFLCTLEDPSFQLLEHQDAKWLTKENLESVNWLDADITLIQKLKKHL